MEFALQIIAISMVFSFIWQSCELAGYVIFGNEGGS
jgi:hypothetical protein